MVSIRGHAKRYSTQKAKQKAVVSESTVEGSAALSPKIQKLSCFAKGEF